jgi:hypothetical protein
MGLVHRVGWDPALCARSPWFWPLTEAASHFARHADWPTFADFDAAYAACTTGLEVSPLRFRDNVRKQDKRAAGRVVLEALYDARIALAHEVPTRERNWHDLLNMLCFATFPLSKLALHARQYARLQARVGVGVDKLPNRRTPEQDALTLFDEGGVVLAMEQDTAEIFEAAEPDAREALCLALLDAKQLRVVPFGHALYEHLVEGLRCPGGCTQLVVVDRLWEADFLRAVDCALSDKLRDPAQLTSPRACGHVRLSALAL